MFTNKIAMAALLGSLLLVASIIYIVGEGWLSIAIPLLMLGGCVPMAKQVDKINREERDRDL
jgi:hypothetical protein